MPNRPFEINRYVSLDDDTGDLIHAFYQEQMQINGGAMNRYAQVSNAKGLVMGYFDISKTYLWRLARQFTLGDAMFHSAFGGSFLNHAFLVCSCAFKWPDAPEAIVAKLDASGNMVKDGQVSPDGYAINTSRSVYLHPPTDTDPSKLVPPQTMPHIGDRLDAKGIAWKWYSGGYDDAMAGHRIRASSSIISRCSISRTSRQARRRRRRICRTTRTSSATFSRTRCRRWCSTSRSVSSISIPAIPTSPMATGIWAS